MTETERDRIRRRLASIADELRALAADDFPGRHSLNVESDRLRKELRMLGTGDSEILAQWADRAARKSTHAVDEELEAGKAAIVSPGDSGS